MCVFSNDWRCRKKSRLPRVTRWGARVTCDDGHRPPPETHAGRRRPSRLGSAGAGRWWRPQRARANLLNQGREEIGRDDGELVEHARVPRGIEDRNRSLGGHVNSPQIRPLPKQPATLLVSLGLDIMVLEGCLQLDAGIKRIERALERMDLSACSTMARSLSVTANLPALSKNRPSRSAARDPLTMVSIETASVSTHTIGICARDARPRARPSCSIPARTSSQNGGDLWHGPRARRALP